MGPKTRPASKIVPTRGINSHPFASIHVERCRNGSCWQKCYPSMELARTMKKLMAVALTLSLGLLLGCGDKAGTPAKKPTTPAPSAAPAPGAPAPGAPAPGGAEKAPEKAPEVKK
jgi:hypothetical protein